MLSRRSVLVGAAALAVPIPAPGRDGTQWKLGTHYQEVRPPQPNQSGRAKVEVIEFFWYGCPHCYTLEPHLVLWRHRKGPETVFRTIPVAWRAERVAHARLFQTLHALQREDLHGVVFDAIHRLRRSLTSVEEQAEFARAHDIDPREFAQLYESAAVTSELHEADKLARALRISGVPSVTVNGTYVSTVGAAGSEQLLVQVIDHLIDRELGRTR